MSQTENSPENAGPIPRRLTEMEPNKVTAGAVIAGMEALRELSQMRPISSIAIPFHLAFDDLQRITDAVVKGFNGAKDKAAVLETEVELPFQPFEIEKFTGDALTPASFALLKGWVLTRGESKVKLPVFPDQTAH